MVDNNQSEQEKGFFGFIIHAQTDRGLSDRFMSTKTIRDLKIFFLVDNPFYGLSPDEIERIWAAREALCKEKTKEEVWEIICGGRGY